MPLPPSIKLVIDFKAVPAGAVRDHLPHESVTDAYMGL
jgi:hypothetical protein